MYSLPITTYSDYWRKTKLWSAYFGGLAVLVAGTRYSAVNDLNLGRIMPKSLQSVNSLNFEQRAGGRLAGGLITGMSSRAAGQEFVEQGQINGGIGILSQDDDPEIAISNKPEAKETSRIEVIDKELAFETEYIESDNLPPGTSKIQVKGEKGVRREVVKTFEVGGQPVERRVQSFFELKSPKKEVVMRSTKPLPKKKVIIQNSQPGPAMLDVDLAKLNISKTLSVEATAYTYTGNNTATGIKPREGIIAVDPKVIAMGSRVYVEGYGYAIAADTGGSIRGNKIDVFFSTLRQCINWGRKPVRIHVLNTIYCQ